MQKPDGLGVVWEELASLVESQPDEERDRMLEAIDKLVHDMRHSIGVIYTAEMVLRSNLTNNHEIIKVLDTIRKANRRQIGLVTDLAQPFDRWITKPTEPPLASHSHGMEL